MVSKKSVILLALILTVLSLLTACSQVTNTNEETGAPTPSETAPAASTAPSPAETVPATSEKQSDKSIFTGTMAELSWEQVEQEAADQAVVLFPIAVVEEHGPHMDLSPDILLTYTECKLIKQSLEEKGIHSVIAPPYYWGINVSTGSFPGSFTLKPDTLKAVLSDTVGCLKEWGFKQVFYINLHGDPIHRRTLKSSAEELKSSLGIDVVDIVSLPDASNSPAFPAPAEGKFTPDVHAGADETSWVRIYYPDIVNVEAAKKLKPQSDFYPLGYFGDPANFDREDGEKVWNIIVQRDTMKIEAYLEQNPVGGR